MRIYLLFLSLFFLSINSSAQRNNSKIKNLQNFDQKKIHFGYYIGLNNYNYKLDYLNNPSSEGIINIENSFGLNVGLIGDLKLRKNLNLRFEPGLKTNKLNVLYPNNDTREIKSTYIQLPLLLKYSAKRYNNIRPYVMGGLSTSFNLSSNQDNPQDNASNVFRVKTNTFYYELGFGIDFYFQYFKFSPSIRGVFSLSNELIPDNTTTSIYTGNIDKISTRAIFINFSFH